MFISRYAEARVRSQESAWDFWWTKWHFGRFFFSPSRSVLLCHRSCNGPHSPSSTYFYYQKEWDANPVKIFKKQYSFGNREALDIQYFRLAFELGYVMDQAARYRPITLKARVRCAVSPCEILGWTEWHWQRFFSEYCGSSPVSIIVSMPHTLLNLRVPLARTFKNAMPFRKSPNIHCSLSVFESLIMYGWDEFWKTQIFSEARIDPYTARFLMFSVITNIYNKKTKGPALMELFTATRKLKKFFSQLETCDVCTTGDTAHIDTIFKFFSG